jgi:plasmid maintenance system antidote protein VapI
MSEYPKFGALLYQYLSEQDRTPAWLARRLGVHGGTVSRWLNDGTRPASPEQIVRIADILGISTQRAKLLVAAGYGYQEASAVAAEQIPDSSSLVADPLPTNNSALTSSNLLQPLTPFIGRARELAFL